MQYRTSKKWLALVTVLLTVAGQAYAQTANEITSSIISGEPEFNFMGFGDLNYISRDGNDEDGFTVGQIIAHMTASCPARMVIR